LWLQETGSWDIVSDAIMRGTIDRLGTINLGAVNHHGLFASQHTIAIWWNPSRFDRTVSNLLRVITAQARPGRTKSAVLWTNNPNHVLTVEDPLRVEERTTRQVMQYVHVLQSLTEFPPTWKEYTGMLYNMQAIAEQAFEASGQRYVMSLKDADVYRSYKKEVVDVGKN